MLMRNMEGSITSWVLFCAGLRNRIGCHNLLVRDSKVEQGVFHSVDAVPPRLAVRSRSHPMVMLVTEGIGTGSLLWN